MEWTKKKAEYLMNELLKTTDIETGISEKISLDELNKIYPDFFPKSQDNSGNGGLRKEWFRKEDKHYLIKAVGKAPGKNGNLFDNQWQFEGFSHSIIYEKENKNSIPFSHQRIFFGAPGTGKSYKLNKEAEKYFSKGYERVTFHPNYMYGQFVGTFKPFPKMIEDKETITYDYTPGILLKTLVKAIKSAEPQLLIIEEINRANTAAVFGDFFQLLDRDEYGVSEYEISTSEDVKLYFKKEFLNENDEIKEGYERVVDYLGGKEFPFIKLPSNLYIWATMNSADQGVMPLDTAFKRRWDFEYFGINNKEDIENIKDYKFILKDKEISWNDMRVLLNYYLSSCGVPEDKLMGPYFLKKDTAEKMAEMIENKVLMYIYDDAGKAYRNKIFAQDKALTYSELKENFREEGFEIFNKSINSSVYSKKIEEKINEIKESIEGTKKTNNNEETPAD